MPRQLKLCFSPTPRAKTADKASDLAGLVESRESAIAPVASQLSAPSTLPSSQASQIDRWHPKATMDSPFDLPDSTDWISTSLPAFEPLEAALRCEVCKEFYANPVITTCSHTFCSICIRRSIATDGKCPACKCQCQADKLLPNIAVREIVSRFQTARPKALELAKATGTDSETSTSDKKRKLEDTDIEQEEGELARRTRPRQTRSTSRRQGDSGNSETTVVIPDSEDEGDEEYLPEGMQKCPICQQPKKAVQMFDHVAVCDGSDAAERRTRSKKNDVFSRALQGRQKESTPPVSRLPALNYAMLSESALRKKLKELNVPSWGSKALLIKRHREWLNIYNSNCDASETVRKSQRELLKELDGWERTQGGSANNKESHIMRKDFDGQNHAATHKSQFDDLIANARRRGKVRQQLEEKEDVGKELAQEVQEQASEAQQSERTSPPTDASTSQKNHEATCPDPISPSASCKSAEACSPVAKEMHRPDDKVGLQNPLTSTTRKVPMFSLPEDPVVDVENSTVQ